MSPLNSVLSFVAIGLVGIEVFALVDALVRPANGFVAAGKLTKVVWVAILVAALLFTGFLSFLGLAGVIATLVYLFDVRRRQRGGVPLPGRKHGVPQQGFQRNCWPTRVNRTRRSRRWSFCRYRGIAACCCVRCIIRRVFRRIGGGLPAYRELVRRAGKGGRQRQRLRRQFPVGGRNRIQRQGWQGR